jgi:NADPH-dependent glutamate synthase beta subunit-like oxidoreductase
MKNPSFKELPLFIPHSNTSTAVNKTGSWRFFYPKYDEKTAPCSAACPLGQDIPRIEMLTSRGLREDAWRTILSENPFPAICGRVCFHPCEYVCNRKNFDDPIAVHRLERFLGDAALLAGKKPPLPILPAKAQKVAIAGAGPAGLSAAYFLTKMGYGCHVFESRSTAGGLLRLGIPPYRLPRDILEYEIKRVEDLGVTIHCKTPVTRAVLQKLQGEYDALFVCCGYGRSVTLDIEGGHLALDGLDFLRRLQREDKMSFSGTAAIIGGGNTAVDVARCLARLGADPLIVYRRRIEDMPAFEPEVKMALREGLKIMELTAPIHIRQHCGDLSSSHAAYALTLQKMKISAKKINGRMRVIPAGEKTETINIQNVFVAIGAEPEALWHLPKTDQYPNLTLSHCRLVEQKIPIVYGGDLASPVKSVTDAIASGKQAAMALNTYFEKGLEAVEPVLSACRVGPGPALSMDVYMGGERCKRSNHVVAYDEIVSDYFRTASRVAPSVLDIDKRLQSFMEIESTLADTSAKAEADRCFNCGICNACDYCRLYCPEMAVKVQKEQRWISLDYCKGCGVCATECPRNAMTLEEETK